MQRNHLYPYYIIHPLHEYNYVVYYLKLSYKSLLGSLVITAPCVMLSLPNKKCTILAYSMSKLLLSVRRPIVLTTPVVTELKAVKDTTLQPGYDLSSYEYLVIGNHKGPAPKLRFIVQFEDIPSDCAFVVKAEMHLMYAYTCKFEEYTERDAPIITRHLCTHQVLCPWDETVGSSTYMNTPTDYLDEHTDCVTLASNDTIAKKRPNGYVPFDVTSAARNWVKGDPNCGLIVIDLNESMKGRDRHFYSSKGPSGSRPYLKLTYHKKEGMHL